MQLQMHTQTQIYLSYTSHDSRDTCTGKTDKYPALPSASARILRTRWSNHREQHTGTPLPRPTKNRDSRHTGTHTHTPDRQARTWPFRSASLAFQGTPLSSPPPASLPRLLHDPLCTHDGRAASHEPAAHPPHAVRPFFLLLSFVACETKKGGCRISTLNGSTRDAFVRKKNARWTRPVLSPRAGALPRNALPDRSHGICSSFTPATRARDEDTRGRAQSFVTQHDTHTHT